MYSGISGGEGDKNGGVFRSRERRFSTEVFSSSKGGF